MIRTFILLILSSSVFPVWAAEPIRFELNKEQIEIQTDGRKWSEGFRHNAGNKGVVEYVLQGEVVENWSELVTINYFEGMTDPAKVEQLVTFTRDGLTRICTNTKWNILSQKENNIVYEWSVQGCKGAPDQSEVARAFQGKEGLYVLHYANKKVPMPDHNHTAWVSLFNKASVKKSS